MIKKRTNAPSTVSGGSSNKEFYNNMYGMLLEEAKRQGIKNPEVVAQLGAAQSALETGYGKHVSSGNYFGIKAKKGGKGATAKTKEFVNGQMVTIDDKFRQYGSMQESAADYIAFLKQNKRYKDVLNASTIEEAVAAQGKSGYATDPAYATKLSSIVGIAAVTTAAAEGVSVASATAAATSGPTSTAVAAASGAGKTAEKARSSLAGYAQQKSQREEKRKKSAKKRIRGELDKLFNKKSKRTPTQTQSTTEQGITTVEPTEAPKKRKYNNSPARVIANVIRSLRSVAKKVKTNNEAIINSIERSASQLSNLKNKNGIQLGSDGGISPEMIKPQQFTIADKPYLYYPGGPEGRQIYEASRSGTAGKIAPREIQRQYAKRNQVDVLNKTDMNAAIGTIEHMLDNDSALRKKEFEKVMEYIDTEKTSSSAFNLEDDEKTAIMEKALTAALQNIYRKHPDLLGGGNSGGLLNIGSGGNGGGGGGGGGWRSLFGLGGAATGLAIGGAVLEGGQDIAAGQQNEMMALKQYDLTPKYSDTGTIAGYDYKGNQYKSFNQLPQRAKDLITVHGPGDKRGAYYNEALKRLNENKYSDDPPDRSRKTTSTEAKPSSIPGLKFNNDWYEGKWMDKDLVKELKKAESAGDAIINGNVANSNEIQNQTAAVMHNMLNDQETAKPAVTNIITSPPPIASKPNPETIQTDNKDSTFKNRIYGDMPVGLPSF